MKRVYLLNSMAGLLMLGTIGNPSSFTQMVNSDLSNAVVLLRHNVLKFRNIVTKMFMNAILAIWTTSNDTYGSHTMAVCGYKIYRKEKKILWFTKKTDKFFYELRDGHKTEPRYYDISGHIGFSGLVFFGDIK